MGGGPACFGVEGSASVVSFSGKLVAEPADPVRDRYATSDELLSLTVLVSLLFYLCDGKVDDNI